MILEAPGYVPVTSSGTIEEKGSSIRITSDEFRIQSSGNKTVESVCHLVAALL